MLGNIKLSFHIINVIQIDVLNGDRYVRVFVTSKDFQDMIPGASWDQRNRIVGNRIIVKYSSPLARSIQVSWLLRVV